MAQQPDEGGCGHGPSYRSLAAECSSWADGASSVSREESDALSRSYTVYGALLRLGVLSTNTDSAPGQQTPAPAPLLLSKPVPPALELHVVGADGREGRNPVESARVFAPLCRLVHTCGVSKLRLLLIGPHVERPLHRTVHSCGIPAGGEGGAELTLEYSNELYHQREVASCPGAVAFLFNAGVWGYQSWLPTISSACREGGAIQAVVVTSYNEFEAADDKDTLEDAVEEGACGELTWAWGPERNPFGSKVMRNHCAIKGRTLSDNSHWQCFSRTDLNSQR